jgi:molybdenum cofactor biosynthesis enzyme MoaA
VTGPEHHERAERLAAAAQSVEAALFAEYDDETRAAMHCQSLRLTALGQLHATLALTAATAEAFVPSVRFEPWQEVLR